MASNGLEEAKNLELKALQDKQKAELEVGGSSLEEEIQSLDEQIDSQVAVLLEEEQAKFDVASANADLSEAELQALKESYDRACGQIKTYIGKEKLRQEEQLREKLAAREARRRKRLKASRTPVIRAGPSRAPLMGTLLQTAILM